METLQPSQNQPPIFDSIVKLLEKGDNDNALKHLQAADRNTAQLLIEAADRRKSEIPVYWYRFRPQFREGFTLLHYAMIYGNPEVVKKLLQLGADPKVKSKDGQFTVIHYPCFLGKLENLKALLEEGNLSQKTVQYLVTEPYGHYFVDGTKDTWIWTPLHYACGGKNEEILELLLKLKANPFKNKVLHYASRMANVKIVKRILDCCNTTNHKPQDEINKEDPLKMTALHYACKKKDPKIVDILLKNGADPLKKDKCKKTPVHYAIWNGSQECALKLLESEKISETEIIKTFVTRGVLKRVIEKGLAGVLVCLMDTYNPAFRKIKEEKCDCLIDGKIKEENCDCLLCTKMKEKENCDCLLHKVIVSDSFSADDLTDIVKSMGKYCIEEVDESMEGMTPMLLAASKNKHKELSILFNTYVNLLEKNKFYSEKIHHKGLYRNIIEMKDQCGYAMAHLAVMCPGSDSEFEATVKIFNQIRKKLKSLEGLEELQHDPFMIKCEYKGTNVSAVELAFMLKKPERALSIVTMTKARTVDSIDERIIQKAIENEMQVVDFDTMVSFITSVFKGKNDLLLRIFNSEDDELHPLHIALSKKLFGHVEILLGLVKQDNGIVELKTSEEQSTLHIALEKSAPIGIIQSILDILQREGSHRQHINLPLTEGVQVSAVDKIYDTADKLRRDSVRRNQKPAFSLNDVLTDAVKEKRLDVFENLVVKHKKISKSALKEIVFDKQKEDYARIAVRHADPDSLFKELVQVIPSGNDGDENYTTCFNELIKGMPDVAIEALHQGIPIHGDMDTSLLEHNSNAVQQVPRDVENGNNFELQELGENEGSPNESPDGDQEEGQDGGHHEVLDGDQQEGQAAGGQHEGEIGRERAKSRYISHPLDLMVQLKHEKLLQHPLVTYYLNREWLTVGFWAYCLKILLYLIFLASLSALAQIIRHPVENICSFSAQRLQNSTRGAAGFWTTIGLSISSILFLALEAIYSFIILVCFHGPKITKQVKSIFKCSLSFKKFLEDSIEFLLHFTTIVLSLIFSITSIVFTIKEDCHSKSTWRVGIFAVVLSWTYFIKLISELPFIGEYALPFIAICKTFLKLTFFGILLIFGSTIVLDMIFYNPMAPNSPFSTFDGSLIKLITMVTGEIDFHDTFAFSFAYDNEADHEIYDRSMAYFIWVLFLILIPILLSNTLIALAVGDASEIKQNANIAKLEMRVRWVTGVKAISCKLCSTNKGCCNCNSIKSCLIKLRNSLSKLFDDDDVMVKKELTEIKFHHMLLKEEKESIKSKYSYDESSGGTEAEMRKTIKEIAKSNQTKLRDLKRNNDRALHRLQVSLDHVKKDLKRAATTKS